MSIAKGKRTEGSPSLSKTKFRFDLSQLEKLQCFTRKQSVKAEKKRIGRIKSTANGLGRSETETEVNGEGIETEGRNRRASQRGLERKEEQSCSPDPSKTLMNEVIYKIETEGVKAEWKQDEREDCIAESQPIESDHHIWRTTTTLPIIQQTQKSFLSTQGGTHPNTPTHHHYPQPQPQNPYLLLPPQQQYPPTDCYYKTELTKRIFQITYQQISRDPRTTVMIKNIPNKYSLKLLSDQIDSKHSYTYDFLYLPFDFDNNCNVGYAFINFLSLEFLKKFYEEFQNRRWMRFRSVKICVLTYARLQGRNSLIEHFHNSKVLNQKEKRYRPIIKMGGLEEMLEMQRRGQSSGGQQATQFIVPRQEPPPTTTPIPPTP